MTIIWCIVPEIWSTTDRTFCNSGPFFFFFYAPMDPEDQNFRKNVQQTWRYHFTNTYHKWQSHDSWFLRYEIQQAEYLIILDHFLPFYLSNNPKNQNFEKLERTTGDIIILQMCTINDDQMIYGSWDIEPDIFFCHFGPFSTPPPTTQTQNIKILEKFKKTPWHIIILHMCNINDNHMMYGSWDMKHSRQNFLPFGIIFCPLTS